MRLTTTLLVAAVGVSAHPSGHAHVHRAVHEHAHEHLHNHAAVKRDGEVIYATIDGKLVSWTQGGSPFKAAHKPTPVATTLITTTSAPAPAAATTTTAAAPVEPTTTTAAAPAATTSKAASSSGSSSSSGASTYEAFGDCAAKNKRATSANIAYAGNTGCSGYGSNMKLVQDSVASKYEYVVKAVSTGSALECVAWNKIGPDGGINGFFTGNEALSFSIPAGGSQYVAFDSNTQGGMCCSSGSVPTTSVGEFLCPWLEFDFADAANSGWSGFDASALVAGSTSGPFESLEACTADGSICSTLNAGGGGTNAYLPGDEALDGIGGNLAPGSVSLIAKW